MIYLDNASTKKPSDAAKKSFLSHIDEYGNPSNSHSLGMSAHTRLKTARCGMIKLLGGCVGDNLVFTSGGSEANNLAINTAKALGIKHSKRRVIISAFEHDSLFASATALKKDGFEIITIKPNSDGIIAPSSIASAIDENTVMVSVMTVNNELGTVQPIGEIGRICRETGVVFHTDAVASVGHIKTDVNRDNIDMLSFSAHKFGGFKGVGGLYARSDIEISPMILGGHQQKNFRAGTENVLGICSAYEALLDADRSIEQSRVGAYSLMQMLIDGINKIPECVINTKIGYDFPYTLNFSLRDINSDAVLMMLDEAGICASSGAACISSERSPSRSLLAIGRDDESALNRIRFSISEENTESEISFVIDKLNDIINTLR